MEASAQAEREAAEKVEAEREAAERAEREAAEQVIREVGEPAKSEVAAKPDPAYPTGRRLQMASDGSECASRGLRLCSNEGCHISTQPKKAARGYLSRRR